MKYSLFGGTPWSIVHPGSMKRKLVTKLTRPELLPEVKRAKAGVPLQVASCLSQKTSEETGFPFSGYDIEIHRELDKRYLIISFMVIWPRTALQPWNVLVMMKIQQLLTKCMFVLYFMFSYTVRIRTVATTLDKREKYKYLTECKKWMNLFSYVTWL